MGRSQVRLKVIQLPNSRPRQWVSYPTALVLEA